MLKNCWNWLAAGTLLVLGIALSGCGAGILPTVHAATDDTLTIQVSIGQNHAAMQMTTGAAQLPAQVGVPLAGMKMTAVGGDAPYQWSVASGSLPAGITLGSDGTFSGTPTDPGTWFSTLQTLDRSVPARAKTQAVTFTVAPATLRILTLALNSGRVGSAFSQSLSPTGGTPNYTWSLKSGALPAGLSLSSGGVVSGTPKTAGIAIFGLSVKDSGSPAQTATQPVVLMAVMPQVLDIATASLNSGLVNTAYSMTLAATGGTPNYHWSVSSGTLPAGLLLNSAGTISGTPTTTGTSNVTFKLTDDGNPTQLATKALALTIAASPLTVTTGTLASGQSTTAYAAQLSATGGTPAYTWSITSGSLPGGLTLGATTGTIQGTPSATGSSTFTYKVTDNGSPQQTATATATLTITAPPVVATNTWFVRTDGGTRFDIARNILGQCDGRSDAAYPGVGINQHCAVKDLRWLYSFDTPEGYGYSQWAISGGDTVVIRGCSAASAQQNPDNPHCRIGWDRAEGNYNGNYWCAGVNQAWGCSMPPIPSGTATQHTRILGGCAYGTYSCNPVVGYPYTNNNLTQIFGGFASGAVMHLDGSQYVDVQGIEITTHNGACTRVGYPQYPASCSMGIPLSDIASYGIVTTNTTGNIKLQDVYIHGMANIAMGGPIGGKVELNRVSLDFNAFAGWNFDNGMKDATTVNGPGSQVIQHYVTMVGNGCLEEYPIQHTQFPALSCWDTNTGGFGDAWSGQDASLDTFTCDHCYLAYNVKDEAMGPHTVIHTLSITDSVFANAMGQVGKWANDANSTFLFQNNFVVADCLAMTSQIPGARQASFGQSSGLPGAYLTYCRAAGTVFSYFASSNSNVLFDHNTMVTYQPTVFDFGCAPAGTGACATSPYKMTNNIFLGYTVPDFGYAVAPGLYYVDESSVNIQSSHNLEYGVRNGDTCGTNGTLCVDPLLAGELPQGSARTTLDTGNYSATLSLNSPARGAAGASSTTSDLTGALFAAPGSIGALEYGSSYALK